MCKIRIVGLDGASSAEFPSRGGHDFRAPRQARHKQKRKEVSQKQCSVASRDMNMGRKTFIFTLLFSLASRK